MVGTRKLMYLHTFNEDFQLDVCEKTYKVEKI